jgi:hypothetical protein
MEALKACYGDGSSDSDSESAPSVPSVADSEGFTPLPPPPISLLDPPSFLGMLWFELIIFTNIFGKDNSQRLLMLLIFLWNSYTHFHRLEVWLQ